MDLGKGTSNVAQGSEQASDQYSLLTGSFETIDKSSKATVACVQGPAFGGGVGLALACDIRMMAECASIRLTEVRLGLVPATIFSILILDLCTEDLDLALESRLKTLRNAAPGASGLIKDLVRSSTRESAELSRARVKDTFHYMMTGSKESAYSLSEFQRGVKDVDWDAFEVSRGSRSKL
ncbi:hypothetical protein LTR37_020318 [Vermiconidia calcicola]|uniref:Uncharacterized protein n=1 Tax=Vermiconidia calcicola TaxID=1690605 RepID=A0ACC3MBS6_9PEZI|nr:hypothetical protein LTR37_020318 [Vermiconidia calcicola]